MSVCNISDRRCLPCEGGVPPLSAAEISSMMKDVPAWQLAGKRIERNFVFANHYEVMSFVNAVAWVSHRQDHHPEMKIGYKDCLLSYMTHAIDGLSDNDFICAAKVDRLLDI